MPKRKNPFGIRRIRKRRQALPQGRVNRMKRLLHRYDHVLRYAALIIVTVIASTLVYYTQQEGAGWLYKASVLEAPQPFTGTVYPVDKIPDWTHWDGDNHTTSFSQVSSSLLAALPAYDLQKMQFPSDSLEWGNPTHDDIRNTKITYSVVYLGNYELDHQEGVGSHLAVDIRMPVGTPIKSIANGTVTKVSMTESGFGHHVVVMHRNVPDPDNPNEKTTLYSAFNHMDQIYVTEGQRVQKGEVLGTSGETGTATTPHLHFQIDRDSAPWHPYWPFTSAEAQAAGLSFFEAVNAGLGLQNARSNTVNPMEYVAKYLDYSDSGTTTTTTQPETTIQPEPEPETQPQPETVAEDPVVVVLDTPEEPDVLDTSLFAFQVSAEPISFVNTGVTVTVKDMLNQIGQMSDSDTIKVTVSGVGEPDKKVLKKSDFQSRVASFVVKSTETGTSNIMVGKSALKIEFINEIQPIASLRIDTDGNYQKNRIERIKLVALDENDNPTPVVNFAGVINVTAKEGNATFEPSQITTRDFQNGVAEVQMTVDNEERVKVRAQNGAIIGESDYIYVEDERLFIDVSRAHPNYEAIKYLETEGIINGYPDGTFKPGNTVNRVEALKMLMLAFGIEAGPGEKLPFSDTEDSAWYATTLATAVGKAIVKGYDDGTFKPAQTVNKAEYLKMLFLTAGITPDDDLVARPYDDVPKDAWYAPFAYLMNRKNLLDVPNNRLAAANGMTRGDVAETIYRLRYIQDNDLVTYSK